MINAIGLSIGLTVAMGLFLFIWSEWEVDRYHTFSNRIYRVITEEISEGETTFNTGIAGNFGPAIATDFPGIEQTVRIVNPSYITTWVYRDRLSFKQQFCVADPDILEVFDLPLVAGDPETALLNPDAVVITESTAKKFFGAEDPIGKPLKVEGFWGGEYQVQGVIQDIPSKSTLQFDILSGYVPPSFDTWKVTDWRPVETYLLLADGTTGIEIEKKIPNWINRYKTTSQSPTYYHLQPFERIYLYSGIDYGIERYGDVSRLRLMLAIGIFTLLIAVFNFINLTTARASDRTKEVGIRKLSGASRGQLIRQFLAESLIIAFASMVIAINLLLIILPSVNEFFDKELVLFGGNLGIRMALLLGFTLLIGLMAGLYPAFLLASFRPVNALLGKWSETVAGYQVRRILVILQFIITSVLLVSTAMIYHQWHYLRQQEWGFNKDQVVALPLFMVDPTPMWTENWLGFRQQAIKAHFLRHPQVVSASVSHVIPPMSIPAQVKITGETDPRAMHYIYADKDFLNTYEIELLAGRNFQAELLSRAEIPGVLLNETAARQLGWENPLGKQLVWEATGMTLEVIGVVKNFLNHDLSLPIQPLFLTQMSQPPQFLSLRVQAEDVEEVLAFLEESWNEFLPTRPFEFRFVDEYVAELYQSHLRLGQIMSICSAQAIFIACLGLFGLAIFMTEKRVKEIGIRKVLGAGVAEIIGLLSKDLLTLVIIGFVIATPLSYFLIENWLKNFAYKTDIEWWIFLAAAIVAIGVAFITVACRTRKAAMGNPVESLRVD